MEMICPVLSTNTAAIEILKHWGFREDSIGISDVIPGTKKVAWFRIPISVLKQNLRSARE
jgi:hypothetical protein